MIIVTLIINRGDNVGGKHYEGTRAGGAREGAGRPTVKGVRRVIAIRLPETEWAKIDAIYAVNPQMTQVEYFRRLHYLFDKLKRSDDYANLPGLL